MESYAATSRPAAAMSWRSTLLMVLVMLCLLPATLLAQQGNQHEADARFKQVDHFVVIYQENWSFDSLYGLFPGANGLFQSSTTSLTQRDRLTGQPYSSQLGQPYDLVSGSVLLTTPPPPIDTKRSQILDRRAGRA